MKRCTHRDIVSNTTLPYPRPHHFANGKNGSKLILVLLTIPTELLRFDYFTVHIIWGVVPLVFRLPLLSANLYPPFLSLPVYNDRDDCEIWKQFKPTMRYVYESGLTPEERRFDKICQKIQVQLPSRSDYGKTHHFFLIIIRNKWVPVNSPEGDIVQIQVAGKIQDLLV